MTDFINKVFSVLLAFVILVLGPLLISYKTDEMMAKRLILNDVNTFIDRITDSGVLKQTDIDELYLLCNSHGIVVDVTVERLVYHLAPDGENRNYDYVIDRSFESQTILNDGDIIRVKVEEAAYSASRRLTYRLLKVDEGDFEFSLCGMVG